MNLDHLKLSVLSILSFVVVVGLSGYKAEIACSQAAKEPTIYINPVRFTKGGAAPWNNITADPTAAGVLKKGLKDAKGNATAVSIEMLTPTGYPFSKTYTNKESGLYPPEVLARGWGSKEAWSFKISGLKPNYLYTYTFFSAQRNYEGDAIQLSVNGVSVLYEGLVNNSKQLLKVSVKSDAKGAVTIKVDKVDGGLSSIAAMVIEDAADNYFEPVPYDGAVIATTAVATESAAPKKVKRASNNNKNFYSETLENKEAAISKKRMVMPDPNPMNHAIEMYGGYEVDWADPKNKTVATANVHDPESAWNTADLLWKDDKLVGVEGSKPTYYFKQKFQHVKQSWKDLSTYYYMNRETRLDTIVFYQAENRQLNPEATCSFWYSLWGSTDNFTWTNILDSISFHRSNRWRGYVTNDENYYCYLRLKIETSDPNIYHGCKTNSALIKLVASGTYRGGLITSFKNPDDLPTAVETGTTFNDFFGTNGFNSDPDTLRAQFNYFRSYMSYGDFSNEIGGKFFINQNTNGQYSTHFKTIQHKGKDGYAVRWLKNDIAYRNQRVKDINPDIKISYCIQQGANWYVNQKAKNEAGWYYYKDLNKDKKVDYPEEFLPFSTTSYLLTGEGGIGKHTQDMDKVREIVTEYRIHPEGYEKAKEVLSYWTQDGDTSGWIKRYFNVKDPKNPYTEKYNNGMRIPWDKHKALADPTKRDSVLTDPRTFAYDACFFYNLTAVHGPNEVDEKTLWVQPGQVEKTGLGVMDMLEWENETDQDWHGPLAHMWPRWAAAYMSAIMDGHMGQIPGPHNNYITGYMCAAPLLDFLYQGSTADGCYDVKLALDALVALRTKRKKELEEQGITKHPGNGMPLYVLPPNFWANWHHYSGTSGGQRSAQYLRFPNEKDEKGLTATDDSLYYTIRRQTAWLKSFYPEVKTTITEWGVGTYTGGKFSPLKQDFGIKDEKVLVKRDSTVRYLEGEKKKLQATAIPDKNAIARLDKQIRALDKVEPYSMPPEAGMFYQQANWLIRGSLEIWFSGLDKLAHYWLSDKGGYYDIFSKDPKTGRLMPDHERKWMQESKNNFTTFTGMGLYGNPKFGQAYPPKTSAYAFHNMKRILGDNKAVSRRYLNEKEKIKSFLTYNEEHDYYAMVVFKATANNLSSKDFEIRMPANAENVEVIDFVRDSYVPVTEKIEGTLVKRTITEKPIIIKFTLND